MSSKISGSPQEVDVPLFGDRDSKRAKLQSIRLGTPDNGTPSVYVGILSSLGRWGSFTHHTSRFSIRFL